MNDQATPKITWTPRLFQNNKLIMLPNFLKWPIFESMMFIEYKITKGGILHHYSDELYTIFTMFNITIEEGPDYKCVYFKLGEK